MASSAIRRSRRGPAAVLTLLACGLVMALASTASAATAIQTENALPGTPGWRLPDAPYPSSAQSYAGLVTSIDGYTVEQSVAPGGTVELHVAVATPGLTYRIKVYRLGWYGGAGARGKACVPVDCASSRTGVVQPATPPAMDPATGEVEADWPVTDTIAVGDDWVSGYYVAMLELTNGPDAGRARWVPFVVRAPGSRSAALVQVPVTTWLAYNGWGGKSVYDNKSVDGVHATKVSFARPYWAAEFHLFDYEYPLVRFLEREGYDLSYATDVNVHRAPSQLRNHKLVMISGHDEYWTKEMRDGFDAARDAGVNLANMGANNAYWQVRLENDARTMVSYKTSADPFPDATRTTVRFRDLATPRPECRLFGVQYDYSDALDGVTRDYGVVDETLSHAWFAGTGFTPGSSIPKGVGYEWDMIIPGCQVPPLTRLFHWSDVPGGKPDADAVTYTAPSGARVFSGGSMQLSWGLDGARNGWTSSDDPRLKAFMRNAITDLTAGPAPPPPANVAPTAAFTFAPTAPVAGATVTFTDTSSDPDGTIAARAWDLDDDGAFDDATGSVATRSFAAAGTHRVRLRATDDDGATAIATRQVVVSAPTPPGQPPVTPPSPAPPASSVEPPPPAPGTPVPSMLPPGSPAGTAGPNAACARYGTLLVAAAKRVRTDRARVKATRTRSAHNAAARRLKTSLTRHAVLKAQRTKACTTR